MNVPRTQSYYLPQYKIDQARREGAEQAARARQNKTSSVIEAPTDTLEKKAATTAATSPKNG